jgi:hypothetical protein
VWKFERREWKATQLGRMKISMQQQVEERKERVKREK